MQKETPKCVCCTKCDAGFKKCRNFDCPCHQPTVPTEHDEAFFPHERKLGGNRIYKEPEPQKHICCDHCEPLESGHAPHTGGCPEPQKERHNENEKPNLEGMSLKEFQKVFGKEPQKKVLDRNMSMIIENLKLKAEKLHEPQKKEHDDWRLQLEAIIEYLAIPEELKAGSRAYLASFIETVEKQARADERKKTIEKIERLINNEPFGRTVEFDREHIHQILESLEKP